MAIILCCNVGTRDVQVADRALTLPEDCLSTKTKQPLPRPTGAWLLEQLRQQQIALDDLDFPMIAAALEELGVAADPKHPRDDVTVVLFTTDQPETTEARFRAQDTVLYEQILRLLLPQRYALKKRRLFTQLITFNPSDYDLMHKFYEQAVQQIAVNADDKVFMLLAGGTPAMNTMLLYAAGLRFGVQAVPLYVAPNNRYALRLDISRQLALGLLRQNLATVLDAYAYPTALQLVEQQQAVLEPEQAAALPPLLRYAINRQAMDFAAARSAISPLLTRSRDLRTELLQLDADVRDDGDLAMLRETIFLAELAAERGDWAEFVTRLVRCEEGMLHLALEQLGVRWSNPERSYFHKTWWEQQRPLLHSLELAAADPAADADNTFLRYVDCPKMTVITQALAAQQDNRQLLQLLADLEPISKIRALRNRIIHDYKPITQSAVEEKAGPPAALTTALRTAWNTLTAQALPTTHPYKVINDLCCRMLEGAR